VRFRESVRVPPVSHKTEQSTMHCSKCGRHLQCGDAEMRHETTKQCSFCSSMNFQVVDVSAAREQDGNLAGSSKSTTVIKCFNCTQSFSTFLRKYEHQIERVCPCGFKFKCLNEFTTHVRIYECQPLETITSPVLHQCKSCRQSFKSSGDLLVHVDECNYRLGAAASLNDTRQQPSVHCIVKQQSHAHANNYCEECGRKSPCGCSTQEISEELQPQQCSTSSGAAFGQPPHSTDRCTVC
jgi:hypothetical protein